MDGTNSLLVVVATEAEAPALEGVELLVCGVGKTAAAAATAIRLARGGIGAVVSFGVAGAYPGSGLEVGDVVVATKVRVLDEGLETGREFVPFDRPGMKVPASEWIATDPELRSTVPSSGGGDFAVVQGPVATVSVCAGSDRLARERAASGAVAEAMEGAAVAHAASHHGVRFAEVRGIANPCGPREEAPFELQKAVKNAGEILRYLVFEVTP